MKRDQSCLSLFPKSKRILFKVCDALSVVYRQEPEMRELLRRLRSLLDEVPEISGFASQYESSNFRRLLFCSDERAYIPLFVLHERRGRKTLVCPQPPHVKVSEVTFGWSRAGMFTYRLSKKVSSYVIPLVVQRLRAEPIVLQPFQCALPMASEDDDDTPVVQNADYEDFDDGDDSDEQSSDDCASSDDEDYVGPVEKKPPGRRQWRKQIEDEGKDPDAELFKLLAEQHADATACDDSAYCIPRDIPLHCYAQYRKRLTSLYPTTDVCTRDKEGKRLRGAFVRGSRYFIQRVIEQWLDHGCSLPQSKELHLQFGADAKSELPIREGRGKVWSLWVRLANLDSRIPLQSARRAVIIAVVLGSEKHARLAAFLEQTDVPAEMKRMRAGLDIRGERILVRMTGVGDLPAVSSLLGITTLGPPFPSLTRHFNGFFRRIICTSCLGTAAQIYDHPRRLRPSDKDFETMLRGLIPIPATDFLYGHLHGVFHLATSVVADCGRFALETLGEAVGPQHAFVKEVDKLFARTRTVGGEMSEWNPFRWRKAPESNRSKRPIRAADPGPVHAWINGGGLTMLAGSARGLPRWRVPKNGADPEVVVDVEWLLLKTRDLCSQFRTPVASQTLVATAHLIHRAWIAMLPAAIGLKAHQRRDDWPQRVIFDVRRGAFGPSVHKILCQTPFVDAHLRALGGTFAETFGEYWLEAAQMFVVRAISKFDIPCRHRTTQCRHLLQRLVECCITMPLRQADDRVGNLAYRFE